VSEVYTIGAERLECASRSENFHIKAGHMSAPDYAPR
jgi:hypothetical protein